MGEVFWRLCRPVVLLGASAAGSLLLATALLVLGGDAQGLTLGVSAVLGGGALLAAILAGVELLLAARAWQQWLSGGGRRCRECAWPWSPSIILPDRCTNPDHPQQGVRND